MDFPKLTPEDSPEPSRDDISTYLSLVELLARRILNRGFYSRSLREDLVSVGRVALCESFQRYNELPDEHFHKSVILRVRGEMIDYLRSPDHRFSRFSVPFAEEISSSTSPRTELSNSEGGFPKIVPHSRTNPETLSVRKELFSHLHNAVSALKGEERRVVERVFFQGNTAVKGTSLKRSHASKIKRRALRKIKRALDCRYTRPEVILHLVQD